MYLTIGQIAEAVEHLKSIHPVYGVTYLVCKQNNLPVGDTIRFPINRREKEFLDRYYKPADFSQYYYRIGRTSDKEKEWVRAEKYASSTIQTMRTQTFQDAFIHQIKTDLWGWVPDYVAKLKRHLYRDQQIPAFYLAIWLYRERDWPPLTSAQGIIDTFFQDFHISDQEQRELFDVSIPTQLDVEQLTLFSSNKVMWTELQEIISQPPDAPQEEGGTLAFLELNGVGPAKTLSFYPGERLNLITGDNGLGKTFLLDTAWWSLTGQWPDYKALPRREAKKALITFEIAGRTKRPERSTIEYDWQSQDWPTPKDRPTLPGFLIYARVDGSFSVWDPARIERDISHNPQTLNFSKDQVWRGLEIPIWGQQTRVYSNGLLRDWISWQNNQKDSPFEIFKKVLVRLSPDPLQPIEPSKPMRLPNDAREFPTITQPYGVIPIVHAAAGIQRITAMAYLIVWAWTEHKTLSEQQRKEPQRRMVVLVDEMEAHLHPRWQRIILPSLLDITEDLSSDLQVQYLIATHSPHVMASAEPRFDENKDKLFHLNIVPGNLFEQEVSLEEIPFIRYGPVDNWLMSEVFELSETRNIETERIIERANILQLEENPDAKEVQIVSEELKRLLAVDDSYWPRWKYFAEQHGVTI